jgi:hypothetical protein
MSGKGINLFLTNSQYAKFQNFENSRFSFVDSHKPSII